MSAKSRFISVPEALKCVMRFADMPGFPEEIEERKNFAGEIERQPGPGQMALVRAFQNSATSLTNAAIIAQLLVDGVRARSGGKAFAPEPADVYFAAEALEQQGSAKEYRAQPMEQCSICDGTGFVRTEIAGCSAVRFCLCHPARSADKKQKR